MKKMNRNNKKLTPHHRKLFKALTLLLSYLSSIEIYLERQHNKVKAT